MGADHYYQAGTATTDRRKTERRSGDRRRQNIPVVVDRREGKDRRLQGERRRQIDPTTCERDYTVDEVEFMKAMDQYKRDNGRQFPTWSEVLQVLLALGYRRVEPRGPLPGYEQSRKNNHEA